MPKSPTSQRKKIGIDTASRVLTEAGYRCAVPTCRSILALDLHHIVHVTAGGSDDPSNLLALCPTCHALHHRGTIPATAIRVWKSTLVSLTRAFDVDTVDLLLTLFRGPEKSIRVSGDGLLQCSHAIASGMVEYRISNIRDASGPAFYFVSLSSNGRQFIGQWSAGTPATADSSFDNIQP